METVKHTDVLIVGAGPSGLMMAAQLLRHGIQPMIIDAKSGPDREPKAMLVHARSLELFRQLGMADLLLAQGKSYYAIQLLERGTPMGLLDFSTLVVADTAFPFIQRVGQDGIARLLLSRLTENVCPVAWETCLESLRQDDAAATVTLVHKGRREHWRCRWVIGADGRQSTVRRLLNIPVEGSGPAQTFFVADVEIKQAENRKIRLFSCESEPLAVIPLGLTDRYRIIGPLPGAYNTTPDQPIRYADIRPRVEAALGAEMSVTRCLWLGRFGYRKQFAEQVHRQRCFLVGDAAHGVFPVLGRGMNEGLYDAANLAWKLAGVVNGRMAARILHTYQQERMPGARMDNGVFELLENSPAWLNWLRRARLVKRINRIGSNPGRLKHAFDRLAGLSTDYRQSPLSVHHASGGQIRAGDRLPYLPVFDEKTKTQTDLHRWCEKPGFVLLVLGTISHHHLNIIGQWMRQKYPREMHLYYLPYSFQNQPVFDAFEVRSTGTKIVLVRPDMYIGYINDMLNVSLIDTYMEEIFGWAFFGHLPEKR